MEERLLDFFKIFSDVNRLRLAALLSQEACTMEEIIARLSIRVNDVHRYLSQMEMAGLLQREGFRYRLDVKALETLSREVLAGRRQAVEAHSNDQHADDFDRQIIKNYSLPDGRLKEIPIQEKRLLPVLRHILQVFEPGVRYNEKQVNEALARYHEDYATLRRYLIDRQMIQRESNGTAYWRAIKE
jgi:hypothetical protein